MQLRRYIPLLLLALILLAAAGFYGLSYVYTPAASQEQIVQQIQLDEDTSELPPEQPPEYP